MRQIRNFFGLPLWFQWLLIKSLVLLTIITVGLRIVPFRMIQQGLIRIAQRPVIHSRSRPSTTDLSDARRVTRAVTIASRCVPRAVCLPQALTAQFFLKRRGFSSILHLGVAKDENGKFEAHAWVELQDHIIIGNLPDLARFTQLPSLEQ